MTSLIRVERIDDYYPFGVSYNSFVKQSAVPNDFGYNGKEKQGELDLGWMDYGWRMYQADLGKWFASDPLADKNALWSPYNYVVNNPISNIDPDGMDWAQWGSWGGAGADRAAELMDESGATDWMNFSQPVSATRNSQNTNASIGAGCPDGNCGDLDVMMAHGIVAKHFDPSQNEKDISKALLCEIGMLYEPGSIEYSAFGSLVGEMWSQVVYLDRVNPSLSELYLRQMGSAETIGDRVDLISGFVNEVSSRKKTFDMIGLILAAYSASHGAAASGSGARATPTSFQYIKQIPHWYSRILDRGVSMPMVDEALANPLHRGAVVTDRYGRLSQQIVGRQATVVINPSTGNRITVWRTGSSTLKKYGSK